LAARLGGTIFESVGGHAASGPQGEARLGKGSMKSSGLDGKHRRQEAMADSVGHDGSERVAS
jgi:hypothetical protein